jgi:hypothetical protein
MRSWSSMANLLTASIGLLRRILHAIYPFAPSRATCGVESLLLAFAAAFAGGEGLFRQSGEVCTLVFKEGDTCGGNTLDDPDVTRQHQMNNADVVVFAGTPAGDSQQLFTATDTECRVLVRPSDPVNGETISGGLSSSTSSINKDGVISITIIKNTVPDSGQDFAFNTTGGLTLTTFSLDDDTDGTLANTLTFTTVAAGGVHGNRNGGGWLYDQRELHGSLGRHEHGDVYVYEYGQLSQFHNNRRNGR